jgi:protein TonB
MKTLKHILITLLLLTGAQWAQAQAPPPPPQEPRPVPVLVLTETKAEPIGGFENFYRIINKNLQYPDRAYHLGIEGKVYVEFTVEKDGTLSNFNIARGLMGADCNEEAIRVLKLSPLWRPLTQAGRKATSKFVIPIRFKLLEAQQKKKEKQKKK